MSGDGLLLGTDMVKDEEILLAAYDDREGVTAEFNLNILRRLNRELGADFDSAGFRHQAGGTGRSRELKCTLRVCGEQYVRIPAAKLHLHFVQGETIHTENSYKFTPDTLKPYWPMRVSGLNRHGRIHSTGMLSRSRALGPRSKLKVAGAEFSGTTAANCLLWRGAAGNPELEMEPS